MKDNSLCEACRISPATNLIPDTELGGSVDRRNHSYRLCYACGQKLIRKSLRPIEWFNLAAIHGPDRDLLWGHYADDGRAHDPDTIDYSTDGMLAPALGQAARSIGTLLDYCATRQRLDAIEFGAFNAFDHREILAYVEERISYDRPQISITCFDTCADVLGSSAESFILDQDHRTFSGDVFGAWARAVAKCVPEDQGFQLVCEALSYRLTPRQSWQVRSLVWFQSRHAIDWIKANAPAKEVTDQWGIVASVSKLSWKDVEAWLSHGRPLRLIALDALKFCIDQRYVREFRLVWPVLHDRPDDETIKRAMRTTADSDDAPRVVASCEFISRNLRWL